MGENARLRPAFDQTSRRFRAPIFLASQSDKPDEIRKVLVDSGISDGWFSLVININTVILVGLIALTADFGAVESLIFLALQLTFTFIGMVTLLFLQVRRQSMGGVSLWLSERLLTFTDTLLMCGWGFGILLFAAPLDYERSLLIIVLITSAGIVGSALNARLLRALIFGRVILYAPSVFYYASEQPPFWGLLICTLLLSAAVSIGIGYVIHIQHLTEANLGIKLRETSILLEQQSFSLERSMLLEHEAQQKLLVETKLRERFLHSVSHDLSQPLSALTLYLGVLSRLDLPSEGKTSVSAAQQCLSSARALIQSVTQLAWFTTNLPSPKIGRVELAPMLQSIASEAMPLALEKGLRLSLVQTSLAVDADAELLERVVRNLVYNAIQYTDKGGIALGARRRGGGAEIIVADTGAGISDADRGKIFEAFYQVNGGKSRDSVNIGLGLSIVRDLVKAMGGQVQLLSLEGKGSIFGVLLPTSDTAGGSGTVVKASSIAADVLRDEQAMSEYLFLAEDSPDYLASISAMLLQLGHKVRAAASKVEVAAINPQSLVGCKIMILDFDLGGGETAFDVLERFEDAARPPFLVISRHVDPNMVLKVKDMGGRFLKKPFDIDTLEETLRVIARGLGN
jgi:signal transduction histidine kinase/CheY-like chemotaxis protein